MCQLVSGTLVLSNGDQRQGDQHNQFRFSLWNQWEILSQKLTWRVIDGDTWYWPDLHVCVHPCAPTKNTLIIHYTHTHKVNKTNKNALFGNLGLKSQLLRTLRQEDYKLMVCRGNLVKPYLKIRSRISLGYSGRTFVSNLWDPRFNPQYWRGKLSSIA